MTFADRDLPDRLAAQLSKLPALEPQIRAAQRAMEPELSYGRHHGPPRAQARRATVVLLLYPHQQQWWIPLTRRADQLPDHPGQVSLPGGMAEAGESDFECGLREWREEMGTDSAGWRLLGQLSPVYVFASNFYVTPLVVEDRRRPDFAPNPYEVARVVELPVSQLLNPALRGSHQIQRGGLCFQTPHIAWDGEQIWGATCQMLVEAACLVEQC